MPSGYFKEDFISPEGEYAESLNEESQEAGPAQAVDSDADLEEFREAAQPMRKDVAKRTFPDSSVGRALGC